MPSVGITVNELRRLARHDIDAATLCWRNNIREWIRY